MSSILTQREHKAGPPNWADVRKDFPIFDHPVRGRDLVYLDNGATTQKPRAVLEATARYYETQNANIHRGNYYLSIEATTAYETARDKVARFIHAAEPAECIFTKGTTESINLVASSLGRLLLRDGDEVVISAMEHHSNIVPWQLACEYSGAQLRVIPVNELGELRYDEVERLLNPRTKIVAVTHLSNVLGTINDVARITRLAHGVGAAVLIDGAQWVAHHATDVQALDCDFYAFSGHKLYGPTGIGVLYGKRAWLDRMPPYQSGGDMIREVTFEQTTYADLPNKFEAGTPNIAGVVGLAAAVDYLQHLGLSRIQQYEDALAKYALQRLREVPGLRVIGQASHRSGVISFVLEDPAVSAYDVGLRLDVEGIAVRTGHHCCQPLMSCFHVPATVRASLGIYNTARDMDALLDGLQALRREKLQAPPAKPNTLPILDDGVTYPLAIADSPEAAAELLLDEFSFLDDWAERYQYIIDLGARLPPFPEHERTEVNRVHGCQSTVYLSARKRPGTADTLDFVADSDADLVRGLIAILEHLFAGQKANTILAFDIDGFLEKLGLDKNLALTRRNGLASMIKRIKGLAHAVEQACGQCKKC